ncbi:MAG: M48 family metalloprotease [Candidatus Aminicenantes bacterium]|nr:M48 family metalloprotease [Candidatus Aminicenantes bacterium]
MIYTNLLYFLVIIVLFSAAPLTENATFPAGMDLVGIFLILWLFRYYNKHHFTSIRKRLDEGELSINEAKKHFTLRSNVHIIIAIILFAIEVFFFDLKVFLVRNPLIGSSETLTGALGLVIFLFHLSIIWHWAFRSMGDVLDIGESANKYILGNVKFNLVIVLPWLFFSLVIELFSHIDAPWVNAMQNSGLLIVLFIFIIAIFAPLFIVFLWDCKPLTDSELKDSIHSFCKFLGVKFRKIMSWDAMNKTLITAGVIGLIGRFRYLLITPQLMELLDEQELLAVVSHEVAHVKKRHLLFYLLFFVGFIILSLTVFNWLIIFFVSTDLGLSMIVTENGFDTGLVNFFAGFILILLFIVYFRFIFGYFMRNFERQADTYCFNTGIGPTPMISSFMKLGAAVGDDGKKSNWHHYNVSQRIDFLRKCIADPGEIKRHNKKVNRSLTFFFTVLLIFAVLVVPFNRGPEWPNETSQYNYFVKVLEKKRALYPNNPALHQMLGELYYQSEKWEPAKTAYEVSLGLNYHQPEVLNNLAWLLLKCPQKELLDPKLALRLARDAARLQEASHIYDTLAESLLANGMYEEAVAAAEKALKIAKEDRKYLRGQLKKMKLAYRESKSIKI